MTLTGIGWRGGLMGLCALASFQGAAQLQSPNPEFGDVFSQRIIEGTFDQDLDEASAGLGMTWDFSDLGESGEGTVSGFAFLDPVISPYASEFPDAGVWLDHENEQSNSFYSFNSGWTVHGFVNSGYVVDYDAPWDIIPYPFALGDVHFDDFSSTFIDQNEALTMTSRTGETAAICWGEGTLTMPEVDWGPNFEISNVYWVGQTTIYLDTLASGGVKESVWSENTFYSSNYAWPLLAFYTGEVTETSPEGEVVVIDYFNTNWLTNYIFLGMETTEAPRWNMMPNPARDRVMLRGVPQGAQNATIRTMDGREVLTCALPQGGTAELDVSGLPDGVYVVHLPGGRAQRLRVQN